MKNRFVSFMLVAGAFFLLDSAVAAADNDLSKGEKLFQQKCRACHSVEAGQHRVGPSLFRVVGRQCGLVPEKPFTRYSAGYKSACSAQEFSWSEDRISAYITDPSKYLSDLSGKSVRSPMAVRLTNSRDRLDIIAFLKSKQ